MPKDYISREDAISCVKHAWAKGLEPTQYLEELDAANVVERRRGKQTMDRLTIRNSDGSVSQPTDLRWAEALDKLAAYEDTGLSPEEIKLNMDGLDEYRKAEAEGRFVVLPCKVGDTVYRVEHDFCELRALDRCDDYCDGWNEMCDQNEGNLIITNGQFGLDDLTRFGKSVFLTREEAEKALERSKNNDKH